VDQMERLEAEISRAVEIISQLRSERDDLKGRCESLQKTVETQQSEIDGLKSDGTQRREEVRKKIESMLAQLDSVGLGEGK
jgi:FtsZ-binding cell division protein ZapB